MEKDSPTSSLSKHGQDSICLVSDCNQWFVLAEIGGTSNAPILHRLASAAFCQLKYLNKPVISCTDVFGGLVALGCPRNMGFKS